MQNERQVVIKNNGDMCVISYLTLFEKLPGCSTKTLHSMRLLANGAAAFERAVIGGNIPHICSFYTASLGKL